MEKAKECEHKYLKVYYEHLINTIHPNMCLKMGEERGFRWLNPT